MDDVRARERLDDGKDCHDCFVVGIGASAGGLEPLEDFFDAVPPDTGMCFVVVQHLSPDFKSHMEELLARRTRMPIHRVQNGMAIQPDSIYLIPPRTEMVITGGRLLLTETGEERAFSHPIDQFFRSLASDVGPRSVAVVLSGTGSDGSRGIRDVHEAGGLVVAQDEHSAKFDGMPMNAQASGVVDLVLPPTAIAQSLAKYAKEGLSIQELVQCEQAGSPVEGLDRIFQLLHQQHGLDFSHYKASTVGRRIQRRIDLRNIDSLDEYIKKLESDPAELNDLYKDLLIGVTKFFRDPEAFEVLEREAVPRLFDRAQKGHTIRVWVAGCASGEEAYSLAIVLDEERKRRNADVEFKIFATDAHHVSLHIAAKGIYPEESLGELSEKRRQRYFRSKRDGFHVTRELRQSIVFAPHNLIHDAPFTQMDLVTCRNLLIYLQPQAQKKALSMFHFALKMGGILFLGPSESPSDLADEFQVIDKRWRVYAKRRDIRLPIETRVPLEAPSRRRVQTPIFASRAATARVDSSLLATYDQLLERNIPPSVLVDERFDVLHIFGNAHRFMRLQSGRPSTNLLEMIHASLKTPVNGAMQHALRKQDVVRYSGIQLPMDDGCENLRVIVEPIADPTTQSTNLHVKFESVSDIQKPPPPEPDESVQVGEMTEKRVVSLESELRYTQENLQATVEEMETSNEELQATNEELVASNEELQSTNEELHSVNEELYTVNAEHQRRVEELAQANQDMDNLLATTRVGVVFIDEDFYIRRFTPEIARVFHLVDHDIGRSIEGFANNLEGVRLLDELRELRRTEQQREIKVTDRDGTPFLLRIVPYQRGEEVSGFVMTLIDISSLRDAESEARRSAERLQAILDTTPEGIFGIDLDGSCTFCNRAAIDMLGFDTEADLIGRPMHDLIHHSHADGTNFPVDRCRIYRAAREGLTTHVDDEVFWRADGTSFPVEYWSQAKIIDGRRQGSVVTFQNISERLEMRRRQLKTQNELEEAHRAAQEASEAKSAFLANMSHELRSPMTAVLGFADMLDAESDDALVKERAGTIRRNGKYLLSLLNDILDLSKIEAGKMRIDAEPTDIRAVIEDIRSLMNVRAVSEGIPLSFEWKTKVPAKITADQVRMRQILVNLISNALKFTDEGEVRVEIRLTESRTPRPSDSSETESVGTPPKESARLEISVTDSGIGMDADQVAQLFQPFTQATGSTSRRYGGTGLGLSISQRLAEAMGGRISVQSKPTKGSRFTLSLPVDDGQCQVLIEPERNGRSTSENDGEDDLPTLEGRFLVADDRRDIWRVVKYFIEKCGGDVVIAEDGRQAVDAAKTARDAGDPFRLIVMDMQMPIMNGREAVAELRRLKFDCPIIALTADAMDGEREECLSIGCNGYFAKPVEAGPLMDLVASLIV